MKTKVLITIICTCSLFKAQAQEWGYVSTLQDKYLRQIWTQGLDTVYIVGDNGLIARSIDQGENWNKQYFHTKVALNDIISIDHYTGFAVGERDRVHINECDVKTKGKSYLPENSRWTEYTINVMSTPFIVAKRQYWTAGDTIITGQTYQKIVQNDQRFGDNGYIGAIREDKGKIYAILWPEKDEFLLYDYTVQVGDVVTSTAPEGVLSYPLTVVRIDEITLETGEKRKLFFFDHMTTWIEGIGSTGGLFHDAMDHPTNYTVSHLVCFKQEDEILYRNEEWCQSNDCCADLGPVVNIIDASFVTQTKIHRENNQIFMDFPEIFSGKTTVRLFDITGCLVYTKITTHNSFQLNISAYQQGIYLISIQNGSNVEYFKLIK